MKIKVKITLAGNMKYYNCPKDTIKEIELEDYIKCVVASEIGNAPLEACKAQAVASRTFVVARGALDGIVISDAAAKGQAFIASRNNYSICNRAVEETEGEVLMYGGRYASTYFSHSNGGRTYSCEEVWGQKRPYLIARKDAWTKEKKNGHGIGLS
jgi:SpoIID/LytB domain protein